MAFWLRRGLRRVQLISEILALDSALDGAAWMDGAQRAKMTIPTFILGLAKITDSEQLGVFQTQNSSVFPFQWTIPIQKTVTHP
jgi:hypothetical protein